MKYTILALSLALFAATAWAQQPLKIVGPATQPKITDAVIAMDQNQNTICEIWGEKLVGPFEVVPGKENECWQRLVQGHNEQMNDPRSHVLWDQALQIAAHQFGKIIVVCAKTKAEPK